jgi:MerR family mercuric resistance operon transcriptional regulator
MSLTPGATVKPVVTRDSSAFLTEVEPDMNATSGTLAMGALSKRTGCKVEKIRYYERAGLLPIPARSPGGYRIYRSAHLKRLTFIRRARALGFSIDEVRKLFKLADERTRPCAEVRVVAGAHLEDVQAKIADLQAMERVLRETVARCASGRRADCPLIETLYREVPELASHPPRAPSRRRKTSTAEQGARHGSPLDLARRGRV